MRWFESCCALRARSQRFWMGRERLRWQQSEMAIALLPLGGIIYERELHRILMVIAIMFQQIRPGECRRSAGAFWHYSIVRFRSC